MNCDKVQDLVYAYSGEEAHNEMPLLAQVQVNLHLFVCQECAEKVERFHVCREMLRDTFMPQSPGLEDAVMAMVAEDAEAHGAEVPGGFSTRGWVIAGLVMLVSLATIFFGMDFNSIALAAGVSYMIPVGITIGIALTSYGALFIGSHLKKLTERFGL
jgi:hypothetical protein